MQFNLLAPAQAFLRPKNQFALFFVAYFAAKLLHLGSHASSLPILLYLLYFPTFLLQDFVLLVVSKLLVYTQNGGQTSAVRKGIGGLLASFTLACSAAQISFFVETGGEIQWMAAGRVMGGSGGMGLLLSGLPAMSVAFTVLYAIAWVITPRFYDAVDHILERIGSSFRRSYGLTKRQPTLDEDQELLIPLEEERSSSPVARQRSDTGSTPSKRPPTTTTAIAVSFTTITAVIVVTVLQIVRPRSQPYAHMSGSLPITILEAAWFQPINSEFCLPHPVEITLFPFERFNKFYNRTDSPDWAPESEMCSKTNGPRPPPWLEHPGQGGQGGTWFPGSEPPRTRPPHGPPRHKSPPHRPPPEQPDWTHESDPEHRSHGHKSAYSPECDPLKLSNVHASLIDTLAESIKSRKPKIKNVLLLTLESTRKDMFPFKKGSHAYNTVLASYSSPNATAELDARLGNLTSTAAFLSDESSGFETPDDNSPREDWRHLFKDGMGGINVDGVITQAAYTLKSLLSSLCGVEPLPVDFTEETKGYIYQKCLPQILEKLSSNPDGEEAGRNMAVNARKDTNDAYHSWKWASAMVQSVTDQFDFQDVLHRQMGFRNVIAETTLSDPTSKHYPPKQPWVNYFGYPETESLEYIRDLFVDAQEQEKRLFVSHLTSSPHHPFATPKDWAGRTTYMQKQRWRPEDPFEAYLNTIKFQDDWVSQIFEMLHDIGALNETLVVMTGDHGLAFKTVDRSQSTVDNGHISNFAIPLLFLHPDLPRIQLNASTTPLSIIPTVLDLLLETDSFSESAAQQAKELIPKYQGNSLIRQLDYSDSQGTPAFFQPFHFSALNPGGSLLAISDAETPFRLALPLCSTVPLRFTNIAVDPNEAEPIIAWTMDELIAIVRVRHGEKAKDWVILAEELGRWWFWNQREKWGYWGTTRSGGRGGADAGMGRVKKKHWWETKR